MAQACLGVPDVTFVPEDAASTADAVPQDGTTTEHDEAPDAADAPTPEGTTAPADAATPSDTGAGVGDSGMADTSTAGCPGTVPPGASVCCDSVPCKGSADACSSECTNCSNNCSGSACCLDKHGNYQGCAPTPTACP